MAKRMASARRAKHRKPATGPRSGHAHPADTGASSAHRKVTYSLPETLARELDRRNAQAGKSRSRMVAEALAFYFAEQDKGALAAIYAEASRDPMFLADNE